MPARKSLVPKYCLHRPSGKAYCRIRGKVIYLGDYDSPESKEKYGKLIAELAAQPAGSDTPPQLSNGITAVEPVASYLDHANEYTAKTVSPLGTCQACGRLFGSYASYMALLQQPNLALWLFGQSSNR